MIVTIFLLNDAVGKQIGTNAQLIRSYLIYKKIEYATVIGYKVLNHLETKLKRKSDGIIIEINEQYFFEIDELVDFLRSQSV